MTAIYSQLEIIYFLSQHMRQRADLLCFVSTDDRLERPFVRRLFYDRKRGASVALLSRSIYRCLTLTPLPLDGLSLEFKND